MRKFLIIAVAAGLATVLSACGPDAGTTSTAGGSNAGSNAGGAKKASCDLATPALIKQTLGLDVGAGTANDNGSVTVCTYPPAAGSTHTVLIRFETDSSAAAFKAARDSYAPQNMQTADFPGFVDEAYTNSISALNITTNTLVARKGSLEILMSAAASFDQEKALEQKLFDALG
jgi:hypothetical protein